MDRKNLVNFYRHANYKKESLSMRGIPPRPKEWNVPLFISKVYKGNKDLFDKSYNNGKIEIELDMEDINYFKTLLLHESLFNFYKSFYNYICALKLYDGGLEHWIEITTYYAKFYLANSIITLTGKSRYIVNGSNNNFVEDIYKLVNKRGYDRNKNKNGFFKVSQAKYGIDINIDPVHSEGKLVITNNLGSGGSHNYIWNKYAELDTESFGLTEITYDYASHLSDYRNLENYSFEGYDQLDFNLNVENFKSYFQRDYIKKQSHLIYTSETAIVLGVIGEIFNLFKEFEIIDLPLEKEKLIHICKYSLDKEEVLDKLIDLIEMGFPSKNKYIEEYNFYECNN